MLERGQVGKTLVWDIVVPPRRRRATGDKIQEMRHSLREHGLLTPIGIRIVDSMEINGKEVAAVPVLVFGATRLEAAKQEGWREIDAQILTGNDIDFQKAEIIENLHRAELTVLERAEWTAALVELCLKGQTAQLAPFESKRADGRGHRMEGGINEAARESGIERTEIQRAVKIASLAPEAQEAARAAGLANNQSALLRAAAEPTPEAQVAKVNEIAERKRESHPSAPRTEPSPAAVEFAAFVLERVAKADLRRFLEYVRVVEPDELAWALRRATVD